MYHLVRFGTVDLPDFNQTTDISAGSSRVAWYDLPGGGSFDNFGAGAAPLNGLSKLSKKCTIHAESQTTIQQKLDALKGMIGTRQKLYARLPDGSERWLWARLVEVKGERKEGDKFWLNVDLAWSSAEIYWHGAARTITGSGNSTLTLTNAGNATILHAIITVNSPAANLGFTVTGKSHFTLTGVSGQVVIDCGAMSVTVGGVEAYSKFALQTDHKTDGWLEIAAPSTPLIVSGSGSVVVSYEDGWR